MAYTLSQLRGAWGAGKAAAEKEVNHIPLEGKYFHSFTDGNVKWQGKVLKAIADNQYEIQLYNWIDGAPTSQRIVSILSMREWLFYDNRYAWVEAGDKLFAQAIQKGFIDG